jgi:hypothetical protein
MRRLFGITFAALIPSVTLAQAKPEFLNINPQSTAPFTPAVRVGNMLYLAGQIGTKDGKVVPGGIGPETKQTLQNIKELLDKAGSDMERVPRGHEGMASDERRVPDDVHCREVPRAQCVRSDGTRTRRPYRDRVHCGGEVR